MKDIKLKDPHHWMDVDNGKIWSNEVRIECERLGFEVRHSEYGESFFYTKCGELKGCGYHRFMDCGCDEVTLEELKAMK